MKYQKNFYQIRSNEEILEQLIEEQEYIGYYRLPFEDTQEIKSFANSIKARQIVVVGIGGSSLGTRAIYEFLQPKERFEKELFFLESTDPIHLKATLAKIDIPNAFFILISKSGNTVETGSIIKYLDQKIGFDANNCAIVSERDSAFYQLSAQRAIAFFEIAKDVGGRFSVFSAVGLLPLAIVGVDIDNMLKGAQKVHQSFFSKERFYDILMEKGRFFVENKHRFSINILFSYSSALKAFNDWYIQLWAESLGKLNVNQTRQGLTPIGLIGPIDQHSFLQLIMEGVKDKSVTFIKIEDFEEGIYVPQKAALESLSFLDGHSFESLISKQADATIEAIENLGHIPFDVITIDKVDEFNIAELIFSYQLLVSIIGAFLQINAYDQPGVEAGKILFKEKLTKD